MRFKFFYLSFIAIYTLFLLVNTYGVIKTQLKADLDKLSAAGIPVDVVFNQGVDILGI